MNALNSLLPYLPISLKNKHVLQLDYDNETTQVLNDQSVLSATVLNTPLGSSASSSIISYSDHNLSNYNITTNKFDLIYSNLQLVQLKQNELILNSIEKSLRLLNLNGFLLIRDVFDEEQATLSPIDFISLIQSKEINDDVNDNHILYGFDLVFAKPDVYMLYALPYLLLKSKFKFFFCKKRKINKCQFYLLKFNLKIIMDLKL